MRFLEACWVVEMLQYSPVGENALRVPLDWVFRSLVDYVTQFLIKKHDPINVQRIYAENKFFSQTTSMSQH
jgi:hypothetical protein